MDENEALPAAVNAELQRLLDELLERLSASDSQLAG